MLVGESLGKTPNPGLAVGDAQASALLIGGPWPGCVGRASRTQSLCQIKYANHRRDDP